MRRAALLISLLFCLMAAAARAAHTRASLLLSDSAARPGDIVWAGVDLKMAPGWHTYWKNSGEAGMPTTIAWQLPPGVTAGEIHWPLPEKFPPAEVTTYGYSGETMLLVPLKIGANVSPGPISLTANLTWLECKDVCIPVKTSVLATLTIGSETKPSAEAPDVKKWQGRVPRDAKGFFRVAAGWEKPANGDTRAMIISAIPGPKDTMPVDAAEFFPNASDNYEILPTNDTLETSPEVRLRKNVKLYSGDWPKELRGVLVISDGHQRLGFTIQTPIGDQPPLAIAGAQPSSTQTNAPVAATSPGQPDGKRFAGHLAKYLLYAFIGGLILNVMPCVLPVIALKILGFVSEARSEPRRVRNLGFIYAAGVLASFAAMAAIVIGIKAAGQQAGWGMQFGSPVFIVCLTTLIVLVALNLFGVFEVTPGGKVLNAAGHLVSRHGAPGAFFNGLLATTLATPCTAPFLAGALAFAFAQSAGVILLIFLFAGIGLAAPYVLLSCNPALLKFLPKPGAWMEKFKVIMGFPMLATAVWLFNVAASDYGSRVLWLGVFLVIVALAAWIFGEFIQRGRRGKGLATAVVVILLVGGYTFALEGHLHWRRLMAQKGPANSLIDSSARGVVWKPWSPKAVAQARTEGKPVLVDFTATWCVTCNAIVKPALENPAVVSRLREINAATLIADYTRVPRQMTDEISKYGGAGVPLVLVFPGNPNAQPIVLRQPDPIEFPSSYSKAILAALNRAELE